MRAFTLVVALLALSTPALAQRAAFTFDLRTVAAVDVLPVDDDQNPATRAWVLQLADARFQLVVAKGGGFCFETPFTVAGATGDSTMTIVKEGPQDMLKVSGHNKGVEVVVNPETGLWEVVVPTYAPIVLVRTSCADRR